MFDVALDEQTGDEWHCDQCHSVPIIEYTFKFIGDIAGCTAAQVTPLPFAASRLCQLCLIARPSVAADQESASKQSTTTDRRFDCSVIYNARLKTTNISTAANRPIELPNAHRLGPIGIY